jgi:hypothetical protein
MPASVASVFERWSILSRPGGYLAEENLLRHTSKPTDVMVIGQSFTGVLENF